MFVANGAAERHSVCLHSGGCCQTVWVTLTDLPTWRMFLEGHFAYKSGTYRQKAGRLAGPTLRLQPTEINCDPKYIVARRFVRGTVWYFCEKSNGFSVITFNWVIFINIGAPQRRYKLRVRKKIRLRTKSGKFP